MLLSGTDVCQVKCHTALYSRVCSFGFCCVQLEGKSVKLGNASFMVQVARVAERTFCLAIIKTN